MSYIGDFRLGDTIDTSFCTVQSTGAPTTLAGSPVISAYVGNSTTQITAGITLTVDFDSVTGYNHVRIVASGGNGYATQSNYRLVITTGTVNSVSAVGYVVAEFSIENRSAVMPTTAARTLDVSAGGEAGVDWANVGSPTTSLNLSGTSVATAAAVTTVNGLAAGVITAASIASAALAAAKFAADTGLVPVRSNTAQAGAATTITLDASASAVDNFYLNDLIYLTGGTGAGQARFISGYVGSTKVATVGTWATNPDNTSTFAILPSDGTTIALPTNFSLLSIDGSGRVDAGKILGTAISTPATAGILDVNVKNIANAAVSTSTAQLGVNVVNNAGSAITSSAGVQEVKVQSVAANAITASAIAADAIGASELAADAVTEIATAVAAISCTEPTAVVAAAPSLIAALSWLLTVSRNKITQTATSQILKADDGSTTIATSTVSDDGTTATRGEFA